MCGASIARNLGTALFNSSRLDDFDQAGLIFDRQLLDDLECLLKMGRSRLKHDLLTESEVASHAIADYSTPNVSGRKSYSEHSQTHCLH